MLTNIQQMLQSGEGILKLFSKAHFESHSTVLYAVYVVSQKTYTRRFDVNIFKLHV